MRAINHALTGAIIGLTVTNPAIAVPAAFVSHFVCDAIPHYGGDQGKMSTRGFAVGLVVDALLCGLLVLVLAVQSPLQWWLAAICAFTAAAPDFAWLPGYIRARRGLPVAKHQNAFSRFAANIQWFEKPSGMLIEVAWFSGAVVLLMAYL